MTKRRIYRLESERLVVRCWRPEDARLLKDAVDASLEHLRPWMPWAAAEPGPLEDKLERIRSWRGLFDLDRDYYFGIFDPGETRVLGACGLHTGREPNGRTVGYWIHAEEVGQGFATEAAAALTCLGFESEGVEFIEIRCDERNRASNAVPAKLGYTHEGTLTCRNKEPDGSRVRDRIWVMFAEEYPGMEALGVQLRAFDCVGEPVDLRSPSS